MSTIDLTYAVALLAGWSATGCDDARAMQRPTPHSPPRSSLSRTVTGAATSQTRSPTAVIASAQAPIPPPPPGLPRPNPHSA